VGVLAVALSCGLLLPACGPADIRGIALTDDGVPTAEDCGAYVSRFDAVDAATDRTVWAAHLPPEVLADEHGGEAPVELGRLPDEDWVEDSPLALDPRPATWVFTIETENGAHDTVRVDDDDLARGMVYRPGHDLVSRNHFLGRTCGLDVFRRELGTLAILATVCISSAWLVGRRLLRRTASRPAP
jgi:hypothetical protein